MLIGDEKVGSHFPLHNRKKSRVCATQNHARPLRAPGFNVRAGVAKPGPRHLDQQRAHSPVSLFALSSDVRRAAVARLENAVLQADVARGRDAKTADDICRDLRGDVAEDVFGHHHVIAFRVRDNHRTGIDVNASRPNVRLTFGDLIEHLAQECVAAQHVRLVEQRDLTRRAVRCSTLLGLLEGDFKQLFTGGARDRQAVADAFVAQFLFVVAAGEQAFRG